MNSFEIISQIGEGAYSVVYKVRRQQDHQIYALKKVKIKNGEEKERENALNEVRILASVKNQFVISYKEAFFDEVDDTLCIVMEYADNGDGAQRIKYLKERDSTFEELEIWSTFIQLVKGLKALHDLKIGHRDLKSANVFLFGDGRVKLGDGNVSKVGRIGGSYTQTGTPYYASPEVWRDEPYNNKSDIWSLGCVGYELISGKLPFRDSNMDRLFKRVIQGQYNRLPSKFSADLQSMVKLLLNVKYEERPSCSALINHSIIQNRIEYFKSIMTNDDTKEDPALIQTIQFPKSLLGLSDILPKPNYSLEVKGDTGKTNKRYLSYRKQKSPKGLYHKKEKLLTERNVKEGTHKKSLPKIQSSLPGGLVRSNIVKNIPIENKGRNKEQMSNGYKSYENCILGKNAGKMRDMICDEKSIGQPRIGYGDSYHHLNNSMKKRIVKKVKLTPLKEL